MAVLGVIMLLVCGLSSTYATILQSRANPDMALPLFFARKPPRSPWQANVMFGLAGGSGVLGGLLLFGTLGPWAFLVMFGAWSVAVGLQLEHNRGVGRIPTTWP